MALLMSTHNIRFCGELSNCPRIIIKYSVTKPLAMHGDADRTARLQGQVRILNNLRTLQIVNNNYVNHCPAEPGYTLPLQTLLIQISWLLQKPTDLDLHCLSLSI